MTAGQLHETLKQRILQLSDQDQIEILSNIEVTLFFMLFISVVGKPVAWQLC